VPWVEPKLLPVIVIVAPAAAAPMGETVDMLGIVTNETFVEKVAIPVSFGIGGTLGSVLGLTNAELP
jgi:hypothetical protein